MSNKVKITADSTCDLGRELLEKYNISVTPLHINLNEKIFEDGVTIQPEEIYDNFYETKQLPKTIAVNVDEYIETWKPFIDDGFDVVHLSIGSALSASHQNSKIAAQTYPDRVFPVDSCNLSTGTGLLVLKAAKLAEEGKSAKEIAKEVSEMTQKSHASFILDRLDFMRAGGRCSAVAVLGANLLGLKPSIEVSNTENGKMGVGKKYRGKLEKVLLNYVDDTIARYDNIDPDIAFITHAGTSPEIEQLVLQHVKEKNIFKEVRITRASCTISSHCGPNTLGILFMTK